MIQDKNVIVLIPARGGSKSVQNKNIELLGGRPLIEWAIETSLSLPEVDNIFISTDDEKIASIAKKFKVKVHERPAHLATDMSLVIDTVRELKFNLASNNIPADIMVLLEATSPFRKPEIVSRCIKRLIDEGLDSIATFNQAPQSPERLWRIENSKPEPFISDSIPWKPRQQLKKAYELNGVAYVFRLDTLPADGPSMLFGRVGAEVTEIDQVVDIDTKKDFIVANSMLDYMK